MTTTESTIIKEGFVKVIKEERIIISELDKDRAKVEKKSIWVMKFVVLKSETIISHLMIYDSKPDVHDGKPKKIIVIDEHSVIKQTEEIEEEKFCLIIYKDPTESVILAYDSLVEIIDWELSLNVVIENIKLVQRVESHTLGVKQEKAEEHKMKINEIYQGVDIVPWVETPPLIPPRGVKQEHKMKINEIYQGVDIVPWVETPPLIPPRGVKQEHKMKINEIYQGVDIVPWVETPPLIPPRGVKQETWEEHKMKNNMIYESVDIAQGAETNPFSLKSPRGVKQEIAEAHAMKTNMIYGDYDPFNKYHTVEIQNTETAKRLNLHGIYTLKLCDDGIQLLDKETGNVIYSWPVRGTREKIKDIGYTRNLENSKNLKIENDIYGDDVCLYTVKIFENKTAKRLALRGDYDLKLRDDTILLLNMETNDILFSWPVEFLRRYECSNNTFSFDTGRRSETGVGRFVVSTIQCEIIAQKVFEMCEHVKESKAKSDSYESESTESHEITDREEPRDDTTTNQDIM